MTRLLLLFCIIMLHYYISTYTEDHCLYDEYSLIKNKKKYHMLHFGMQVPKALVPSIPVSPAILTSLPVSPAMLTSLPVFPATPAMLTSLPVSAAMLTSIPVSPCHSLLVILLFYVHNVYKLPNNLGCRIVLFNVNRLGPPTLRSQGHRQGHQGCRERASVWIPRTLQRLS